jgi:hypothetical protein
MTPDDPEENGPAGALAYTRRRIDTLTDQRFVRIETKVDEIDRKVDALSNRLAWLAGGLAVLSVLVNIIGPIIVRDIIGRV